jgi:hypothetical protein
MNTILYARCSTDSTRSERWLARGRPDSPAQTRPDQIRSDQSLGHAHVCFVPWAERATETLVHLPKPQWPPKRRS